MDGLLTKTKSSPLRTQSPTRLSPKLLERGGRNLPYIKNNTPNGLNLLVAEMKVENDGVIPWQFAKQLPNDHSKSRSVSVDGDTCKHVASNLPFVHSFCLFGLV